MSHGQILLILEVIDGSQDSAEKDGKASAHSMKAVYVI